MRNDVKMNRSVKHEIREKEYTHNTLFNTHIEGRRERTTIREV